MIQRVRIGILASVLGVLLLHFTLVWLHVNPLQKEPGSNFWGQWYCSPFFSQGWNMFVPVPEYNYMLFVEYEVRGKKQKKEIFQSLVEKHRANRVAGHEALLIAFVNSIHYFVYATDKKEKLNGPVKGNLYFEIVKHAARQYTAHDCQCEPAGFSMILLVQPLEGRPMAYF